MSRNDRLGDSQLFRTLMFITIGQESISTVVKHLIRRTVPETP